MPKKSIKPEICVHRACTGEKNVDDLIVAAYSAYFEEMMLKSSGDTFALRDEEPYNGVNENSKEDKDDGSAA